MTKSTIQTHKEDILAIRGPQVRKPKDLTVGRWYVVELSHSGTPVHAKLTKITPDGFGFTFAVCASDVADLNVTDEVKREFNQSRGVFTTSYGSSWGIYKFKTHPDKVAVPVAPEIAEPVAFPAGTTARDIGAKHGDRFQVVTPRPGVFEIGDVLELVEDDRSSNPFFSLVRADGTLRTGRNCMYFGWLAPLEVVSGEVADPEPEQPVLHEIDQLKSEIDALVANATAKRDEAAGLQLAAGKMEAEAEALRQKLADSLSGYLPKKPIPFRSF